MIKAVIFDVDGTLLDSVDQHAKAWQDAFADYGYEIGFSEIRAQIGKGGDQLLPVFLSEAAREAQGSDIEARRSEILKQRYLSQIRPFPKVRELFARLSQDGIRPVLASSAKQEELQQYKKLLDIEDFVEVETTSDDAEKSKPEPDIFEAAMGRLPELAATDVLVIGDTPYDAEAASKAGLRTIGVLCGGFSRQSLLDAGCVAIHDDPAALLANYDKVFLNFQDDA